LVSVQGQDLYSIEPKERWMPHHAMDAVRRLVESTIESMMEEQLGEGLDYASRRMCVCHSTMFHVCLTKKILTRGLVSPRDHTTSRLCSNTILVAIISSNSENTS
jgi:type IV secretory pathway VirD2 relaxase